jgi:hypothetical protein
MRATNPSHDDNTHLEGKWRLTKLLPKARKKIKNGQGLTEVHMQSPLAKAQAAHIREDNLDAVIVYPAPLGGWHVDVLLRYAPPGVPNSFGSPVGNPYRTRAEAEQAAVDLLVVVLTIAKEQAQPTTPVFLLFGGPFKLIPDLLCHPLAHGWGSKEAAIIGLTATMERLFGAAEPTTEQFKDMTGDQMVAMSYAIHRAALDGVFAYPIRRDKSPSGHDENATRMKQ